MSEGKKEVANTARGKENLSKSPNNPNEIEKLKEARDILKRSKSTNNFKSHPAQLNQENNQKDSESLSKEHEKRILAIIKLKNDVMDKYNERVLKDKMYKKKIAYL